MKDTIHKRLEGDGRAFRGDPGAAVSFRAEPGERLRARRKWVAPIAAAAATVSVAAGIAVITSGVRASRPGTGAQPISDPYRHQHRPSAGRSPSTPRGDREAVIAGRRERP